VDIFVVIDVGGMRINSDCDQYHFLLAYQKIDACITILCLCEYCFRII